MQRLINFARIVRRYFNSAANIPLDDQETQLKSNQKRCAALSDSCKLAETAISITTPKMFAIKAQKKLLEKLIGLGEKEGISPNSWAVVGFNVICKQNGRTRDCLPITKMPPPATDGKIIEDAEKTFKYMYSGEWMRPVMWESTYEEALEKANLTKNSKIVETFNDTKKDYLKEKDKPKK